MMSSGAQTAQTAKGALHSLSTQPPPPPPSRQAWPTNEREAKRMNEARRLKNIVKRKEQRLRAKERKREASRQARRNAEIGQLVEDVILFAIEKCYDVLCAGDHTLAEPSALIIERAWRTKMVRTRYVERTLEASRQAIRDVEIGQIVEDVVLLAVEKCYDVPCARDRTQEVPPALTIQRAWRTKMVRTRYARTFALKVAEKRRQRSAVRSIETAWRQFQDRKALANSIARVDEIMAPYRRKRAELMRAAAEVRSTGAAEEPDEDLAPEHSAAIAGLAKDVESAGAAAEDTEAEPAAAEIRAAGAAGQASEQLGNVLLNTIRASRQRQEQAAADRAATNAEAGAEMEAHMTVMEEAQAAADKAQAVEQAALEHDLLREMFQGLRCHYIKARETRYFEKQILREAFQGLRCHYIEARETKEATAFEKTLLREVFQGLRSQCIEARYSKKARLAQAHPRLRLPPARKHATGPVEDPIPHPLQPLEGQTLRYFQQEFDVWAVMDQLQGWSLQLGVAPVWGGGVPRAVEEYATVCGFSAAFGPLLFKHAIGKVFDKTHSSDVSGELPAEHVADMFNIFWEEEIAPFGAAERLFRLVGNSDRGGIVKKDLRPFLLEIVNKHPHLDMLAPDDVTVYIETILEVAFYRHSRCGVISLHDPRTSNFVTSLNATGRLEIGLEDSEYFSLARYETIRGEYLSLCQGGPGVGREALSGYRHDGGPVVGTLRAKRVIAAEQRQRPRCESSGLGAVSTMGENDQELSYDGWIRFYLCEEALMFGQWSERGIKYCFDLVDDEGVGRVGRNDVAPFYEDMHREYIRNGGNPDEFGACDKLFIENLDAMGVEAGREDVTLVEMRKPGNVKIAGRFFSQLFLGLRFNDDRSAADECVEDNQTPPPPPFAVPYQQCQEHREPQRQFWQDQQQHYQQQDQQFPHQPQYHQPEYHQQYQESEYHQQQQQSQYSHYHQQYQEPQQQYQQYQPQYQHQFQQQHNQQYYQPQQQNQQYYQLQQQQYQQQLQQYQEPYHYQHQEQQQQYQQMCPTWGAGYEREMGYVGHGHGCRSWSEY